MVNANSWQSYHHPYIHPSQCPLLSLSFSCMSPILSPDVSVSSQAQSRISILSSFFYIAQTFFRLMEKSQLCTHTPLSCTQTDQTMTTDHNPGQLFCILLTVCVVVGTSLVVTCSLAHQYGFPERETPPLLFCLSLIDIMWNYEEEREGGWGALQHHRRGCSRILRFNTLRII